MKWATIFKVNTRQRECGRLEYLWRRIYSGIFYFRLYRYLHPSHPFFTPRAIRTLEPILSNSSRVFEFGSGASTLWFTKRVDQVIVVEHDYDWHLKTSKLLKDNNFNSSYCIFKPTVSQEILGNLPWQIDWKYYDILGHAPAKPEFLNYISTIDEFDDECFDVISIDGRERIGCLIHSIPKLKKHGILIFDDSCRPRYAEAFELLKDWPAERYEHGLCETTLFTKP